MTAMTPAASQRSHPEAGYAAVMGLTMLLSLGVLIAVAVLLLSQSRATTGDARSLYEAQREGTISSKVYVLEDGVARLDAIEGGVLMTCIVDTGRSAVECAPKNGTSR